MSYLYLLQTRESIKLNESIYKIGQTKQEGLKRFTQYPNGSELILHIKCDNCVEKEKNIKDLFKTKFKQVTENIGTEYFMGDVEQMKLYVFLIANTYDIKTIGEHVDDVAKLFTVPNTQPKSKIAEILINNGTICNIQADDISQSNINQPINLTNNNSSSDNVQEMSLCKETIKINNFVCETCNMSYKTQNGLLKHIRINHKNNNGRIKYNCDHCNKQYNSRQSRWVHIQKCKDIYLKKVSLEEKVNQLTQKVNTLEKNPTQTINNKIIFV